MARRILCAVLVGVAALMSGCKEEEQSVPAACLDGPRAIRGALKAAPGDVSIDGTKLSECLVKSSDTGELTDFGASMLDATTQLVVEAKRTPDGAATLQLGYLHGALQRGAETGIHDELMRRLDQELISIDKRSSEYRRGDAAGREHG